MILDRERRYGPSVVSKIVPLEACEEIEVWWDHDDDGPKSAKGPKSADGPKSTDGTKSAPGAKPKVASAGAALPAITPVATIIRSAPFRSRRPPPPRYHPGAVFDSTPVRRSSGQIFLGLVLGLGAIGLTVVGL